MISKTFNKMESGSERKLRVLNKLLELILELEHTFKLSPELDQRQVIMLKEKINKVFDF